MHILNLLNFLKMGGDGKEKLRARAGKRKGIEKKEFRYEDSSYQHHIARSTYAGH